MSKDKKQIADLRSEYAHQSLYKKDLLTDPVEQFMIWFDEAIQSGLQDPNAMILGTVGSGKIPSLRTVLLKGVENGGFEFYTNYDSRKAKEIDENPNASLLFLWKEMHRQVRIEGHVEKISAAQSTAYFQSRPKGSQISATASNQSSIIENKTELEKKVAELEKRYKDQETLPRPENWGGYRLIPNCFEFWIGRPSRLHDRFQYTRKDDHWKIDRLAP